MYTLRPYCDEGYDSDTWIYGPTVPPGWTPGDDLEVCPEFEIQDPQTLKTTVYHKGNTVDLDLVIQNPNEKPVSGVRVWLNYDPTVLTGGTLTLNDTDFPIPTPGEIDFDSGEGYVMINISTDAEQPPDSYWIHVARIQFTVENEVAPGTPINFYDVQREGHTYILSKEDGEDVDILSQAPGSLFVQLEVTPEETPDEDGDGDDGTLRKAGDACLRNDQCESGLCVNNICNGEAETDTIPDDQPTDDETTEPEAQVCSLDGECESGTCYESICQEPGFKIPVGGACRRDNQCSSLVCSQGVCSDITDLQIGEGCASDLECASGFCQSGICAAPLEDEGTTPETDEETVPPELKRLIGAACIVNEQCQSNFCVEGVCRAIDDVEAQRTAFSLLQVRNFRVTSEGATAYLKWDDLQSSMLKAYNVYYSTTSGQYIQRKTVPGSSSSITIRNLPEGTKYFFAIRAVNINNEESAFSQEVAITIGNPASSTAPLIADIITDAPGHPLADGKIGEVPGETGASTIFVVMLLISAVVGTFLAFRRQLIARPL